MEYTTLTYVYMANIYSTERKVAWQTRFSSAKVITLSDSLSSCIKAWIQISKDDGEERISGANFVNFKYRNGFIDKSFYHFLKIYKNMCQKFKQKVGNTACSTTMYLHVRGVLTYLSVAMTVKSLGRCILFAYPLCPFRTCFT